MTRIRIGALRYINALPFFYPLFSGRIPHHAEFIWGNPREINGMLKTGDVNIGMVSSLSFLDRRDDCVLISDIGIASTESVQSVCLFVPTGVDPHTFEQIFITQESETAYRLLKVLCRYCWNIFPTFTQTDVLPKELIRQKKPFLSIGDTCLELLSAENVTSIDLAKSWHLATGKSFIFALLATNNSALQRESAAIFDFHYALDRAFHWSQENLDEIIDYAHAKISTVSKLFLTKYYTEVLEYRLSSRHFQGLEYFSHLERSGKA